MCIGQQPSLLNPQSIILSHHHSIEGRFYLPLAYLNACNRGDEVLRETVLELVFDPSGSEMQLGHSYGRERSTVAQIYSGVADTPIYLR